MERYSNLRGNSPVIGYDIEPHRITVWFKGGKPYSYSYTSAGASNVETMKKLAREGAGPVSYTHLTLPTNGTV